MGVASGPDGKGIPTIASRQCNSHSLIFLIASTQRVILRLSIPKRLVVLWFSGSVEGEAEWCRCVHHVHRPPSLCPMKHFSADMVMNIRKVMGDILQLIVSMLFKL